MRLPMYAIPSTIAAIVMKSAEDVKKCLEIKGLARVPGRVRLTPGGSNEPVTTLSVVDVHESL